MRYTWAAYDSDVGRQRESNEDKVVCQPEQGLYAVIDGVGGEVAGEEGAEEAAIILRDSLVRNDGRPAERRLREAIALANKRLFDMAQEDPSLEGMSCVLTVALVESERLTIGHVGDTRLYRLRRGMIEKLTHDHSPVGEMEELGEISEQEAMHHPRRNEIFRDLGSMLHDPDDEDFIEIIHSRFAPDEALLLCSDGLSDQVTAEEIRRTVEENARFPQKAIDLLITAANQAGGRDNVSVVLVVGEEYPTAERAAAPAAALEEERAITHRLHPPPPPETAAAEEKEAWWARQRQRWRAAPTGEPSPGPDVEESPRAPVEAPPESDHQPPTATAPSPREGYRYTALRGGSAPRRGRLLNPRLLLLLLPLLAVAVITWLVLSDRLSLPLGNPQQPLPLGELTVGPEGDFATIAEALEAARAGQVIMVAPGVYEERLKLKERVSLRAQSREAVLRPPPGNDLKELIRASGIEGAEVMGFSLEGTAESPLVVGLRLINSQVLVENLEITGATDAAVEILGPSGPILRFNTFRDNPGAAVRVGPRATPRLANNLIADNGAGGEEPGWPGVEVLEDASPTITGNTFSGNAAAGIWLPSPERVAEVARRIESQNTFENQPQKVVVRPAPDAAAGDSAQRDSGQEETAAGTEAESDNSQPPATP